MIISRNEVRITYSDCLWFLIICARAWYFVPYQNENYVSGPLRLGQVNNSHFKNLIDLLFLKTFGILDPAPYGAQFTGQVPFEVCPMQFFAMLMQPECPSHMDSNLTIITRSLLGCASGLGIISTSSFHSYAFRSASSSSKFTWGSICVCSFFTYF